MSSWSDWHTPEFSAPKSSEQLEIEAKERVASALIHIKNSNPEFINYGTYQGEEELRFGTGTTRLSMKMLGKFFPAEREALEPILVKARAWILANPRYVGVSIATVFE